MMVFSGNGTDSRYFGSCIDQLLMTGFGVILQMPILLFLPHFSTVPINHQPN